MVDFKFSVLDNSYHLTTDERQYILNKIVPSKAKNAVDGFVECDPKYFRSLENVWDYIERTAPIQTGEVLLSLRDLERVQEVARGVLGVLRDEVCG